MRRSLREKIKSRFGIKTLIAFVVFAVLLAADLTTKGLQQHYVFEFDIIPGYISVGEIIWNDGVSFSLFSGSVVAIEIFTTVLAVILLIVFLILPDRYILTKISVGTIMAGAIGNLTDRYMYGAVRDFIHDNLITHTVLNLADLFITIGIILIVLDLLFFSEIAVIPVTKHARKYQKARREEDERKRQAKKAAKEASAGVDGGISPLPRDGGTDWDHAPEDNDGDGSDGKTDSPRDGTEGPDVKDGT